MESIVALTAGLPGLKRRNDDDTFDRLNSYYTVILLLVFTVVVGLQQYGGSPITCWAPVHFTGPHIRYMNSYCWIKNTYYLAFADRIPKEFEPRQVVPYYQWIPFILLTQALLYFMPSAVWHGFNSRSGMDSDCIMETAGSIMTVDKPSKREERVNMVVNQMTRFLGNRCSYRNDKRAISTFKAVCCHLFGKRFGSYLVMLFVFSKFLYIINSCFQFYLLNFVLGTRFDIFGIEMLQGFVRDHFWEQSPFVAFPRVTMCDFKIRRLGNVQRYTVQCTLPINMYNEKIYMFLWFWIIFVCFSSVLGLLIWLLRFFSFSDRIAFVRNHLQAKTRCSSSDDIRSLTIDLPQLREFVGSYLKQDGVFLLRLISHNTNNIVTTDITFALWNKWRNEKPSPRRGTLSNGERPEEGLLPPYNDVPKSE